MDSKNRVNGAFPAPSHPATACGAMQKARCHALTERCARAQYAARARRRPPAPASFPRPPPPPS